MEAVEPPKVSVTISCSDVLPITLTKTGLDVLKSVVDTYTSAVTRRIVKTIVDLPPFIIKNETGLMAELLLEESNLQVGSPVGFLLAKKKENLKINYQFFRCARPLAVSIRL